MANNCSKNSLEGSRTKSVEPSGAPNGGVGFHCKRECNINEANGQARSAHISKTSETHGGLHATLEVVGATSRSGL
jgi:hypothetical protein